METLKNYQNTPMWRDLDDRITMLEYQLKFQKSVLTFVEAAGYSGLSKSCLYKLTSTGKIPHFKPNGKNIFFDRIDLETWLKKNPIKTKDDIEIEASSYVTNKRKGALL